MNLEIVFFILILSTIGLMYISEKKKNKEIEITKEKPIEASKVVLTTKPTETPITQSVVQPTMENIPEKDEKEVVAVIMAAVSSMTQLPPERFVIRSIKKSTSWIENAKRY